MEKERDDWFSMQQGFQRLWSREKLFLLCFVCILDLEFMSIMNECFMLFSLGIICYLIVVVGTVGLVGFLGVGKSISFLFRVVQSIFGRCWEQQSFFVNVVRFCEFRIWNLVWFLIRVGLEFFRVFFIKKGFLRVNRNGD